jgi:hypothetical protein
LPESKGIFRTFSVAASVILTIRHADRISDLIVTNSPAFAHSQAAQDSISEAMAAGRFGPSALKRRADELRAHYDRLAPRRAEYIATNSYYYDQVCRLLHAIVPHGKRVLQVGCLTPDFLASVKPSFGVGIDSSIHLIDVCRQRFPNLTFHAQDDYAFDGETFDYVLITNLNDDVDPIRTLNVVRAAMTEQTRLIVQHYNHFWEPIIRPAERLGLKFPLPQQNWLATRDIKSLLNLCDYEVLQVHHTVLFPKYVPLLTSFANGFLARLPGMQRLNLLNMTVARPAPARPKQRDHRVSVVIPCRNEVGNVASAVERMPPIGSHTEIIFCDDNSTDGTADEVRRLQRLYPERDIKLYAGPGICKALNVRTGFDNATGDILMILDADLTTMPEELPQFYNVIASGKAEFVNGSRFVFPMEGAAMRPLNTIGNRFFSSVFSILLGQRITDTLCGTKVLWRRDWPAIRALSGSWGPNDRWGDYDLLFGAARLHLRIVDLPVHYQERVSGETKMTGRLRNGWIMLRMCWAAFLKFKLY